MKKKFLAALLVLVCLATVVRSVNAAETRAAQVRPELTIVGTTAECEVSITDIGKSISVTMVLWQGTTLVDYWSATGQHEVLLHEICEVERGKTYTLKVSGTIGGESFNATPVSVKCN